MREKVKKLIPIGGVVEEAVSKLHIAKKMRQYKLWQCWKEIAGPAIYLNARPVRWNGEILVVAVKHASWMQELTYLKSKLMEKIREAVPEIAISDIRFEIGKIAEEPLKNRDSKPPDDTILSQDEIDFIESAACQTKDDEAAEIVRRLMAKDFTTKKTRKKNG
jgi:predicted nucleic acid-binding Zn ribbon protein